MRVPVGGLEQKSGQKGGVSERGKDTKPDKGRSNKKSSRAVKRREGWGRRGSYEKRRGVLGKNEGRPLYKKMNGTLLVVTPREKKKGEG